MREAMVELRLQAVVVGYAIVQVVVDLAQCRERLGRAA